MGEFRLPVNGGGYVTIPKYLRERYLTPDADQAVVQPIGTHLQILIASERDDLLLRLDLDEWVADEPRARVITRGGIHIERWLSSLHKERDKERIFVVGTDQTVSSIR